MSVNAQKDDIIDVRIMLTVVVYDVCDGLSVSSRTRTAAVYAIVNVSELVCDTVGLSECRTTVNNMHIFLVKP